MRHMVQQTTMHTCTCTMLEVAKQQVCMSVPCMLRTFLKYRDHYISNIIGAAPMQCCNYNIIIIHVHVHVLYTQLYIEHVAHVYKLNMYSAF